jgi:hypothetical protein
MFYNWYNDNYKTINRLNIRYNNEVHICIGTSNNYVDNYDDTSIDYIKNILPTILTIENGQKHLFYLIDSNYLEKDSDNKYLSNYLKVVKGVLYSFNIRSVNTSKTRISFLNNDYKITFKFSLEKYDIPTSYTPSIQSNYNYIKNCKFDLEKSDWKGFLDFITLCLSKPNLKFNIFNDAYFNTGSSSDIGRKLELFCELGYIIVYLVRGVNYYIKDGSRIKKINIIE